jgi:hypothetical protein
MAVLAAHRSSGVVWHAAGRMTPVTALRFSNRVTEMLGVDIPIVQAPMGWIARAQLASAVSNAGAVGIIETSSGELDTPTSSTPAPKAVWPPSTGWRPPT